MYLKRAPVIPHLYGRGGCGAQTSRAVEGTWDGSSCCGGGGGEEDGKRTRCQQLSSDSDGAELLIGPLRKQMAPLFSVRDEGRLVLPRHKGLLLRPFLQCNLWTLAIKFWDSYARAWLSPLARTGRCGRVSAPGPVVLSASPTTAPMSKDINVSSTPSAGWPPSWVAPGVPPPNPVSEEPEIHPERQSAPPRPQARGARAETQSHNYPSSDRWFFLFATLLSCVSTQADTHRWRREAPRVGANADT